MPKTIEKIILGISFSLAVALSSDSYSQKTEKIAGGIAEYNEKGQIVKKIINNGHQATINYEYDDKGMIKTEIYRYADRTETWQHKYDAKGLKTEEKITDDFGSNKKTETRKYSYKGNKRSKTIIFYDDNGDGKTDRKEKF